MNNSNLTSEEKKELERRGFYVDENISFIEFTKRILSASVIFYTVIGILSFFAQGGLLSNMQIGTLHLLYLSSFGLIYLPIFLYFVKSRLAFYGQNGAISYGTINENDQNFLKKNKIQENIFNFINAIHNGYIQMLKFLPNLLDFGSHTSINVSLIIIGFLIWPLILLVVGFGVWGDFLYTTIFTPDYASWITLLSMALVSVFSVLAIIPLSKLILSLTNIVNPLYAFGNLGQKIQSLTPRISEQSKQIESGFQGDMDFRVLSQSFDTLASTFSQIVNLVVKLEKVEQKANKGNLFDSDKYINSLREDIRTPLLSLKTFLEKKKTELQNSEQELMRVRVSVGGEGENRKLQSVRSQELLKELDENIGKLDVMLEKI